MVDTTIKDVAKRAGVSIATVSRVINRVPSVRPETIKRVHDAIADINYVPNATARNLKIDKTKMVGLLISNISNAHFTSMAKSVEKFLRTEGYSVIVCSTDDDPQMELTYLYRLLSLRIEGLILNTTGQNNDYIAEMSHILPIVLVDRSIQSMNFNGDFIGSNNYDGVQSLTRHLIDCGHRKIGIITSNLLVSTGRERLKGFVDTMESIDVEVDENYLYRYDSKFSNVEGGIDGCKYLMSLNERPTAIVAANNDTAIGVYKYLHANHISVPGDVSVVSYGNINNCELFRVEPTYTTLNPNFIGEKAANYLLSRVKNQNLGSREVIFEPLLIINESTRIL
jgi:LacI family transcriptional regulator